MADNFEDTANTHERPEVETNRKSPRWYSWTYPTIQDVESAKRASRQGLIAALIVATMTIILAVLGAMQVQAALARGFDAYALIDASLFLAIAVGLWRHSRIAAVSGLVLHIGERLYMWSAQAISPGGVAILLAIAFLNGVRGTFALHEFAKGTSGRGPERIEPS